MLVVIYNVRFIVPDVSPDMSTLQHNYDNVVCVDATEADAAETVADAAEVIDPCCEVDAPC